MTGKQKVKLNQLIQALVKAEVDSSWAGSQDPDDRERIRDKADNARQRLRTFIESLTVTSE